MGLFATAQTWTPISQHVSGVNYFDNTETISTQAILGSGKAMVIGYSATWCSWCYVMHQNGILAAGVYFVRIVTANGVATKKFVKE